MAIMYKPEVYITDELIDKVKDTDGLDTAKYRIYPHTQKKHELYVQINLPNASQRDYHFAPDSDDKERDSCPAYIQVPWCRLIPIEGEKHVYRLLLDETGEWTVNFRGPYLNGKYREDGQLKRAGVKADNYETRKKMVIKREEMIGIFPSSFEKCYEIAKDLSKQKKYRFKNLVNKEKRKAFLSQIASTNHELEKNILEKYINTHRFRKGTKIEFGEESITLQLWEGSDGDGRWTFSDTHDAVSFIMEDIQDDLQLGILDKYGYYNFYLSMEELDHLGMTYLYQIQLKNVEIKQGVPNYDELAKKENEKILNKLTPIVIEGEEPVSENSLPVNEVFDTDRTNLTNEEVNEEPVQSTKKGFFKNILGKVPLFYNKEKNEEIQKLQNKNDDLERQIKELQEKLANSQKPVIQHVIEPTKNEVSDDAKAVWMKRFADLNLQENKSEEQTQVKETKQEKVQATVVRKKAKAESRNKEGVAKPTKKTSRKRDGGRDL